MKGLRAAYGWVAVCIVLGVAQGAGAVTQTSVQDEAAGPTAKSKTVSNSAAEKYDTKLPVEISSDSLEVLQHENKAIFTGNVIAVQGKIRLTSDVMIVHYKQQSQPPQGQQAASPAPAAPPPPTSKPDAGKPAAPASAPGTMGAITLIEVEGNVFMATPEESAKGDKGNYQVAEKLLHLTGDNVILTRDKNILRGTEMVYNLETGRSVLTNKGAKVTGPNGGRVRGVFVPNQDDKGGAKNKAGKKPAAVDAASPVAAATAPGK